MSEQADKFIASGFEADETYPTQKGVLEELSWEQLAWIIDTYHKQQTKRPTVAKPALVEANPNQLTID